MKAITAREHKLIADAEARLADLDRKLKVHALCIICGIMLAIAATFLPLNSYLAHLVAVVPAVPSLLQEALDRLLQL